MIHQTFESLISHNDEPSVRFTLFMLISFIIFIVFLFTFVFLFVVTKIFFFSYVLFERISVENYGFEELEAYNLPMFLYEQDLEMNIQESYNSQNNVVGATKNRRERLRKIDKLVPRICYERNKIKAKYYEEECVICLEDYREGELCRILPNCNHMFHLKCIDVWLENHYACPICRQCIDDL